MSRFLLWLTACVMLIGVPCSLSAGKPTNSTVTNQTSLNKDSMTTDSIKSVEQNFFDNLMLPPIDLLFESAKNSPIVKYYESRQIEEKNNLRALNLQWTNVIRVNAGYQYGRLGSISSIDNYITPIINQITTNNQNYYNIGASVSIPLELLLNLGNKARAQKERINQTEYETARYYDEQKLLIAESYTTALKCINMIKVRSEALKIAEAQYLLSMEEFVQNKITASDLSRMKNIQSAATGDYELTKAELLNALLRLEILSGYKFLK